VTDPTLRMPDTVFRAVLDLGDLPLEAPPLPTRFRKPELNADWFMAGEEGGDDDEDVAVFSVEFADGQLRTVSTTTSIAPTGKRRTTAPGRSGRRGNSWRGRWPW